MTCASSFILHPSAFILNAIMLDLIFILATIGFYLLALAYVRGCEKL